MYVVSVPGSSERFEVPLWQLTEPASLRRTRAQASLHSDYLHTYARVGLDGLPARAEASNSSKRVYRLRKGEIARVMYKGDGEAPKSGDTPLEGEWLRVMAKDGTQGWCFSRNLELFTTERGASPVEQAPEERKETDFALKSALAERWVPECYREMIDAGAIDLDRMDESYGFVADEDKRVVRARSRDFSGEWAFSGIEKTDDSEYTFEGAGVKMRLRSKDRMVATCPSEGGRPRDIVFITLKDGEDVASIVEAERARRALEYSIVVEAGPVFKSANYGTLALRADGTFSWKSFKLLSPSVVSAGAKGEGSAAVKYRLSDELAGSYTGALTFKFGGMDREVNFFYKIEDGGLRMEDATKAAFDGASVARRGSGALVMFFKAAR